MLREIQRRPAEYQHQVPLLFRTNEIGHHGAKCPLGGRGFWRCVALPITLAFLGAGIESNYIGRSRFLVEGEGASSRVFWIQCNNKEHVWGALGQIGRPHTEEWEGIHRGCTGPIQQETPSIALCYETVWAMTAQAKGEVLHRHW